MIDSELAHSRLGARTRRIVAASATAKAVQPCSAVESTTLLGASPPRKHASSESIII